jgi:hypothetical protein
MFQTDEDRSNSAPPSALSPLPDEDQVVAVPAKRDGVYSRH